MVYALITFVEVKKIKVLFNFFPQAHTLDYVVSITGKTDYFIFVILIIRFVHLLKE